MAAAVGLAPPGASSWVVADSRSVLQTQITVTSLWRPTQSGTIVSSWRVPFAEKLAPDLCQHWR
eukprot:7990110-Lingulodinium_polyedra.AAC.1